MEAPGVEAASNGANTDSEVYQVPSEGNGGYVVPEVIWRQLVAYLEGQGSEEAMRLLDLLNHVMKRGE